MPLESIEFVVILKFWNKKLVGRDNNYNNN